VRNEPVRGALGFDLLGGLAEGESFGLCEDVGHEHGVLIAERVQRFQESMKSQG